MSASSNILVNIIGEFKKKGFDDADKATKSLQKSFDTLAKKLAAAFSVAAVAKFAKASIKAFEEDQRAAVRLTGTIKNMGLAFEDIRLQQFISDLEKQSGVLDDQLRPAMQGLLTTTGSLTKSQELLNLAIEVSRGTGESLTTVTQDLGRAYVGQTRGLTKYNLGLTQAELKAKNFSELQALLAKQFSGQQAAYLETYSGKVDMVKVAYANLQEIVGGELINSLTRLSGDQGIAGTTTAMDKFSRSLGDVIGGVTDLLVVFKDLDAGAYFTRLKQIVGDFDPTKPLKILSTIRDIGREVRLQGKTGATGFMPIGQFKQQEAARRKAENDALKRAKALQAAQKKTALEAAKREREAQMLKRAGTVFDMENIQIVAALQGKVSEDQRLRLTALLAINNKNAEAAEKLSMAVLATNAAAFESIGVTIKLGDNVDDVIRKTINAQAALSLVKLGVASIPKAKNPFEDWPDVMANILEQIKKINAEIKKVPALSAGGVTTTPGGAAQVAQTASQAVAQAEGRGSGVIFSPSGTPFVVPSNVGATALDDPRMFVEAFSNVLSNPQLNWQAVGDTFVTNVNVMGSVTSDADLVDMITNEIYKAQKSGKGILLNSVAI